jgi:hypothetical protein
LDCPCCVFSFWFQPQSPPVVNRQKPAAGAKKQPIQDSVEPPSAKAVGGTQIAASRINGST